MLHMAYKNAGLYRVFQEGRSVFWEVIVLVILSAKLYMQMCAIPNGLRDSYFTVETSNTPCPHTSCKVHWCWPWNFRKCIILIKLYQLRHLKKMGPSPNRGNISGFFLEALRKITTNLSHDSRYSAEIPTRNLPKTSLKLLHQSGRSHLIRYGPTCIQFNTWTQLINLCWSYPSSRTVALE
jgi:hypothetical protein